MKFLTMCYEILSSYMFVHHDLSALCSVMVCVERSYEVLLYDMTHYYVMLFLCLAASIEFISTVQKILVSFGDECS